MPRPKFFQPGRFKSHSNRDRSSESDSSGIKTYNNPYVGGKRPDLKVNCWYVGEVSKYRGRPIVYYNSRHREIPLFGCGRNLPEIGQRVVFEVTQAVKMTFVGSFKQFYDEI